MSTLRHVGNNVGVIYGMPFGKKDGTAYNSASKEQLAELEQLLKTKGFQHNMAITNNYNQPAAAEVIHKNKYRPVLTFVSNHGEPETLTVWLKSSKKKVKLNKEAPALPGGNCSVTYDKTNTLHRCAIAFKNPANRAETLKGGFRRIPNTPIYFHVRDEYIKKGNKFAKYIAAKLKPVDKLQAFNF